jgi:hypothetical protein
VKVDPKLDGQWKVPSLVVNGMFQSLVVNGMFQSLVVNGRFQAWWSNEEKTHFHLFPPSFQQFYLNLQFFLLTLNFYFTMVLGGYSLISLLSIYKL